MPFIAWDEKLMTTGVRSIDGQHKILIDMLNHFVACTADGTGKDKLCDMLAFTGAYAIRHFTHEEQIMEQFHCAAAAANKAAHARFISDYNALAAKMAAEGPSLEMVLDVQQKLLNWLTSHICGCDAQLRKCASARAA